MDDNKVAVLIENLMSQFRTFGEGLDGLGDEMKAFRGETSNRLNNLEQKATEIKLELSDLKTENKKEHQQLIQAVKELDTEVIKLKRVK